MAIYKVIGVLGAILIFFGIFAFGPLYSRWEIQAGLLGLIILWNTVRLSWRETWRLLKFILPFVLTLTIFGLIFHALRLQGREDWLVDTLIKCCLFPSSLIFVKLCLSYISYLDILQLPLSMPRRIDLITMKSAFTKGGRIISRLSWYLDTCTPAQTEGRIKGRLKQYAGLMIALYLYLYEEIENSHHLMQNRYQHFIEVQK
jgi:hypothetical protein